MKTFAASRTAAGFALVILSAASFGAMPIFARIAYAAGTAPVTLLAFRFAVATLLMLALLRLRGRRLPRGRQLLGPALMGAVGYVGQSMCYFSALLHASAGVVALLLYLYPALVTLLSALLLRERLTPRRLLALGLALAGCLLIVGQGGAASPAGILLGIGAAAIYSLYILAGSRVLPSGGALESSTVVMAAAAAVYIVLAAATGPRLPATLAGYAALFAIAVTSTVIAITAFLAGLERIGPTLASTVSTLEPVVTVALAAAFLGESLGPAQMAGGALVLAAVLLLASSPSEA